MVQLCAGALDCCWTCWQVLLTYVVLIISKFFVGLVWAGYVLFAFWSVFRLPETACYSLSDRFWFPILRQSFNISRNGYSSPMLWPRRALCYRRPGLSREPAETKLKNVLILLFLFLRNFIIISFCTYIDDATI